MSLILTTDRLQLRRFEPSDVDNLTRLYADPAVMQFIDDSAWDRQRVASEVLPEILAEYGRYRSLGYLAAETHDGSFVGRIALHPVIMGLPPGQLWAHAPNDGSDIVSIGYRLCRDQWGHGYAVEAAGAALRSAFDDHGAARVVATTMAVNRRSRRVLETLGFQHTRTVHLDWESPLPGAESGEVIYERERDVRSTSTAHRQDHPAIRSAEQDHEHR